jgi:very-short-patch-repair endonuclease
MPHTPPPPQNRSRAKSMRRVMTDAELKLWNELRAHRLMGLGFRRQVPIAGFIVDFACAAKRIIVEVDGSQHAETEAAIDDRERTQRLEQDGWTLLRFWNDDVLRDIDGVCSHIITVAGLTSTDATAGAEHHPDGPPLRAHPLRSGEASAPTPPQGASHP